MVDIIAQNSSVAETAQTAEPTITPAPVITPEPQVATSPAPASSETAQVPPGATEAPRVDLPSESPNIPLSEPEKTAENKDIPESAPETAPASDFPTPKATEGQSESSAGAQSEPAEIPETSVQTAQTSPNEPLEPEPSKAAAKPEIPTTAPALALSLLVKAREAIQFRKKKKLEKIMALFLKKPQITNDDVEKLLHVSDATATRYLSTLEKEGKIKQVGKTGTGVSYSRS